MKHSKAFFILVVSALIVSGADIAIFPVNVTNLTEGEGDAIGMVMAQQYSRLSKKTAIGPSQTRNALLDSESNYQEATQALGVAEYILINAVALESKILLEAILYNQSGSEIHRAGMTAASLDDMTEVTDRISRSLIKRLEPKETIDLDNVTEMETEEKNRLFAEKVSGIKTAVMYGAASGEEFEPMANLGYNMRLEAEKFFLEFGVSALLPSTIFEWDDDGVKQYGGVYVELGGSYYLFNNRYASPYIGLGLSPRYLFEPGTVGIAPYLQAGVMFMRISSMRIYTDIRIAQNALPLVYTETVGEYDPDYGYNDYEEKTSGKIYPTEISLQVGIGW
ncbi:MAG: hypothetical protein GF350_06700 [Chitinivibrionales bacterium]|nr:hypothetical protein [Chitinivibrionales bacterium]